MQSLVGLATETQKMMKIFEFAKSKMTWNSIYGMYCDEGVKKAYKEGTGNAADLNLMLTAMFRYAGLNANPVLVSTKNNGIPIFPTRDGFNYVISGVVINGSVFLCDATNKKGEINILEKKLLNWQGRMIVDESTSAWVPLTPSKPAGKRHALTFERHRGVHRVEGVLLQIDHVEEQRLLEGDEVFDGDAFLAGHLHHLLDGLALLQQLLHGPSPVPAQLGSTFAANQAASCSR